MSLLDDLRTINQAVGNDKITVLQSMPHIKPILKSAYDPFKKYYITPPELLGTAGGHSISRETKTILDDLSDRTVTGQEAMETVCDHIVTLNPESARVFKRILAKDLRCGISIKTINKAFPGLIPLVWDGSVKPPFALCKTFVPEKAKYPLLAAVKKDGVRGQYIDKFISRSGKPLVGHGHIESEIETNLDGELCIPGMGFDDSSGIIRRQYDTPESVFWVFDAPSVPGTKFERYRWLYDNLKQSDHVKLVQHRLITDANMLMEFYADAISKGEEGIVIYDPDQEYEDGRIWWRLVPIKSADCKVIGFFEGNGKLSGSLGGLVINYKGHEVKVGTGFKEKILEKELKQLVNSTDKKLLRLNSLDAHGLSLADISPLWHNIRDFIWVNKHHFINKICKVEFKEKTKAGSLRQPRFKCWRFDKDETN